VLHFLGLSKNKKKSDFQGETVDSNFSRFRICSFFLFVFLFFVGDPCYEIALKLTNKLFFQIENLQTIKKRLQKERESMLFDVFFDIL
jgi:hypothetical protein